MTSICFVIYDLSVLGGAERVTVNLANKLSELYDVHLASIHGETVNQAFIINETVRIEWLHIGDGRLRNQMKATVYKLSEYFKNHNIKIAFLEATYVGFICSPLRIKSRTKLVFCDHGSILSQFDNRDVRLMRRISSILCHKIVTLTEQSKNDYHRLFHTKLNKIECIYNWITQDSIDANIGSPYNEQSKTIISVGRISNEKGYDLLVEVAKKVLQKYPGWVWKVFGDGPDKELIKKIISNYKLENQLILKGNENNIADQYKEASFLVLTSYREGMPLVLLEAKAYKVPCVSFDIVTGPNEIILDGINGFLISPYDIDEMADKIEMMILDNDLRKSFSRHAYDNLDLFSESNITEKWIALINCMDR